MRIYNSLAIYTESESMKEHLIENEVILSKIMSCLGQTPLDMPNCVYYVLT